MGRARTCTGVPSRVVPRVWSGASAWTIRSIPTGRYPTSGPAWAVAGWTGRAAKSDRVTVMAIG
ncbi:hypothetical protein GCM10027268_14900 [Brachybacterium huguangmaarense]